MKHWLTSTDVRWRMVAFFWGLVAVGMLALSGLILALESLH